MRAVLISAVPSWLVLTGALLVLAISTYVLVARARPPSPSTDYNALRQCYEPVVRLTTTILIVGMVLGVVVGAKLDVASHRMHFGIAAGAGELAALCFLCIAIGCSSNRSWSEYGHYQNKYRGRYALPGTADIWVLVGFVIWGTIDLWTVIAGT